ncbi:SEC-C domain-containing protein [Spiractinospora alimapuensis]|uniref:SEC-C domain-containing protein n=1 Tax=Spiractinospora alimapuensis TaxID=2820884 RepID=UPI001F2BCA3D|nr:SEC-C domain-containing protein [Spiractinospora alimapuensis]QVQ54077.1 SEC-C domain-containing protein [Spiractinospora alimapuensis]
MEQESAHFRRLMARLAHERRMAWTDPRITVTSLTMFRDTASEAGLADPEALTVKLCDRLIAEADHSVALSARFFRAATQWEQGMQRQAEREFHVLWDGVDAVHLAVEIAEFWLGVPDDERALDWYERALFLECPLDGPDHEDRILAGQGRSSLRARMGHPPDDLDLELFMEELAQRAPDGESEAVEESEVVLTPFLPRSEVARPDAEDMLGPEETPETYHDWQERTWRSLAQSGGTRFRQLVPLTLAEMRLVRNLPRGDRDQVGTQEFYLNDLAERGLGVPWPPSGSSPCWCESGRAYVACCGDPT